MPAAEALPEDETNAPDVGRPARLVAVQALGRDVGQRARDVAGRGQAVDVIDDRETEVEQPGANRVAFLEHDVGGLDVSVHDAMPMRMGERVEKLGCDLDDVSIAERLGAQSLAERLAMDVLGDEVDVPLVSLDRIRPRAVRMAQAGGGGGLPLRAQSGAALAVDDLEGNVSALLLVACAPDGSRTACAQGLDGPVAAQDQLIAGLRFRERGLCHRFAN